MPPDLVDHSHSPLYRVVRKGRPNPLDASYSRRPPGNRWNPPETFMVLYTCCSETVARAFVQDRWGHVAIVPEDLAEESLPQLCEADWAGTVVDMISQNGIRFAGFAEVYPSGVDSTQTRAKGTEWHAAGYGGVVCRSASVWRLGQAEWPEPHEEWAELAIFVENAERQPALIRRRDDLEWLLPDFFREPDASLDSQAESR